MRGGRFGYSVLDTVVLLYCCIVNFSLLLFTSQGRLAGAAGTVEWTIEQKTGSDMGGYQEKALSYSSRGLAFFFRVYTQGWSLLLIRDGSWSWNL
ncbi:hypothetical protein QBC40DRAFT_277995, partial [Triangularia verruculosa]